MLDQINISPVLATALFVVAVLAGHLYRKTWKNEGPVWRLWLYGGIAGLLLISLALLPIAS